MPRTARIAPRECIYHILCRGNNKQAIFGDDGDRQRYLEITGKYKKSLEFYLYHYALMPNHIHLVLEVTQEGGELSEIMKGINLSYALHYKRRYEHTGHFWQDRYKSILISKDDYLLACGSYVELNPIRAGLVEKPGDYRWSSYKVYAYGYRNEIVDQHPIYEDFGNTTEERQEKYREFIAGMLEDEDMMKGKMDRRVVYGSEAFSGKIENEYKVKPIIRRLGRPKKANKDKK
ncbi:transposase IS200 like protein [bacterium BMS3Abin10]|nr:transposase IS200 like protein [bacterium BMS3Abin10]GBE39702.1 transposase IS200 like protein [bacterium BMS3Bbin08]